MSGHADTIRRDRLIQSLNCDPQISADDSWDLIHRWDALVAANQQLRDALTEIANRHLHMDYADVVLRDIARGALAGTPSEDAGIPDPGSFGGHPYTPDEIALGYGTDHDPRFGTPSEDTE